MRKSARAGGRSSRLSRSSKVPSRGGAVSAEPTWGSRARVKSLQAAHPAGPRQDAGAVHPAGQDMWEYVDSDEVASSRARLDKVNNHPDLGTPSKVARELLRGRSHSHGTSPRASPAQQHAVLHLPCSTPCSPLRGAAILQPKIISRFPQACPPRCAARRTRVRADYLECPAPHKS